MKICPQCDKKYNDYDVFCYEDGNALIEDGEEQETRQIQFVMKPGTVRDRPPSPSPAGPPPEPGRAYDDTIAFQPPVFKTPQSGNRPPAPASNKTGIITAFGIGAVLLALVLIGVFGLGPAKPAPDTNQTKSVPTPTVKPPGLPNAFDRQYTGTIGAQGLSMNLKREGGTLTGSAVTSKTDTLSGTIQDNGDFSADAYPVGKAATGIFSGHISEDGSIKGKWTDRQGGKETAFQVQQQP